MNNTFYNINFIYITITNGTAQFGSTAPNQTSKVDNAFTIKVADNIPDKTKITFTITVENGSDTYTSKFYEKIFSPVFIANGVLDVYFPVVESK